jgi:prepilin-type N-terminal cleavage/methylation domain-containing protein
MKNPTRHRASGFTLIELLVVIAIIAVLASVGFVAGNNAIKSAKKAKAMAAASSIITAVNSFQSENGSLPVPSGNTGKDGGTKFQTDTGDGVKILNILMGKEDEINVRKVRYFEAKEGKAKKDGVIYNSQKTEVTAMYDPFGNPYFIVLDTNYEEQIKVQPGNTEIVLPGRKAAVYSAGADKKLGTPDDVKTW